MSISFEAMIAETQKKLRMIRRVLVCPKATAHNYTALITALFVLITPIHRCSSRAVKTLRRNPHHQEQQGNSEKETL
jgi:hypothetical protein